MLSVVTPVHVAIGLVGTQGVVGVIPPSVGLDTGVPVGSEVGSKKFNGAFVGEATTIGAFDGMGNGVLEWEMGCRNGKWGWEMGAMGNGNWGCYY